MSSNWRLLKIGDIGEVVGGGTPSTKNEDYYGEEISWITPKDLSGYKKKYISKGERSITRQGLENSSAKLLPKNTVLLSSRAPIGYVVIASNPMTTNQGFKSVICNEDLIIPDYLYYVLKSSKEKLEAVASGSTFKEVSGKVVKDFEILIPDIISQKKITNILNGIDEKIEMNVDIIGSLEELSQTLFQRWFIDFEFPNEDGLPYKSSGGKMMGSELGEIPEGWSVVSINEITKTVSKGTTPRKKDFEESKDDSNVLFLKVKDIADNGEINFSNLERIPYSIHEKQLKRSKLVEKDLLVSIAGTIGRISYIPSGIKEININQAVAFLRLKNLDLFNVLYTNIKHENFKEYLLKNTVQAVQANVSLTILKNYHLTLPSNLLLKRWNETISGVLNQIEVLRYENIKLQELRDSLLPKLLSGEIEIPEESVVD